MKVAVLGAGSIGFANAALLAHGGHEVTIWSPSGQGTAGLLDGRLTFTGAIGGVAQVGVASGIDEAVAGSEVILLSLPAYGHANVMRALAPVVRDGQAVFVMPMLSLSSLYLARLLHARGTRARIASFGTTVMTARKTGPDSVNLISLRSRLDIAALPARDTDAMRLLAVALFGDRFNAQADTLAIALVNVNPISHVPLALANLSRIEKAQPWTQYDHMTGATARQISAVDRERLQVAAAFGLKVRSIEEHFHHSFGVPLTDLGSQAQMVHERLGSPAGPVSLDTRYFTEDVPYGLAFYAALGRAAGVATPALDACVVLAGAACGRDFATENELAAALGLARLNVEDLRKLARDGY
ncbi:MAG: NAD/NADP octopine/nopaline dehydrogenase family protein [Burkholderiales bacterium]|nr:NAD/NADP octopine/nopaline dehydrogenase family protein [Burkholderiales bacterium]